MREFITGWAATLRIMIFERELYRLLRDARFEEDDFTEAWLPGEGA
jgi:hypothetical protein